MTTTAHDSGRTYEELADLAVSWLRRSGALPASDEACAWDDFVLLSELIHGSFVVPATSITPMMRRLLFAIGLAARPRTIVGVGTYVGYPFAWLIGRGVERAPLAHVGDATGIDVDAEATAIARRNCAVLGHGSRLRFLTSDGAEALRRESAPIDLLFVDLDDPVDGKLGYAEVVEAALPRLRSGSLVLAHDPCVPRFASDFEAYHRFIRESHRFAGAWVLPVDPCGLAVAVAA